MAIEKKDNKPEETQASLPTPAEPVTLPTAYELQGIEPKGTVYVPLANREYNLEKLTQAELAHLHALGWPHAVKAS